MRSLLFVSRFNMLQYLKNAFVSCVMVYIFYAPGEDGTSGDTGSAPKPPRPPTTTGAGLGASAVDATGEDTRPRNKVILLCGPPGTGKARKHRYFGPFTNTRC